LPFSSRLQEEERRPSINYRSPWERKTRRGNWKKKRKYKEKEDDEEETKRNDLVYRIKLHREVR